MLAIVMALLLAGVTLGVTDYGLSDLWHDIPLLLALGGLTAILWRRQRRLSAVQTRKLAQLAAIVRSSGEAIASSNITGVIESWNPGAEELFGYSAEEMIGTNATRLLHPDELPGFGATVAALQAGKSVAVPELRQLRRDASEVLTSLTMSPIVDRGRLVGSAVISRDITERKVKELELAQARNEALESSRLKSQFLATMSHEIRTPLNGVLGLNELMLNTPLSETQRSYVEGIDSAGAALLTVINDILDYSKLEAGKVELEIAGFSPQVLVDEVAALLAVPAHTKGLELLAYCHSDVPTTLAGDAGRIRQILLNLASNAVKFTASGEVMIEVNLDGHGDGEVKDDDDVKQVRFEVLDTGIGLAADGRRALFDSFSQADASTTRRFGGTGLGLAVSQHLVHAMQGEISVVSELGKGSTFWFSLLLPVLPAAPAASVDPSPQLLPGLRVLVVDDNATNRLILLAQLTAWQMVPEAAEDAYAALAQLSMAAAAGHPYDIAVLDLLMPEVDGLELARRKSADPALAHTRMIMLTSSGHVDSAELDLAGIEQWCAKPVRTSALYNRLLRLMAPVDPAPARPLPLVGAGAVVAASHGRILVAEDNEINQLVAEGIATMLGYEVEIVQNGAEAVAALARSSYAAVLMDCHMPVMDGFDATRQIRAEEVPGRHQPIIAMTAAALNEDRERCLAAGMDGYVSKPVTVEALQAVPQQWATTAPPEPSGSRRPVPRPVEERSPDESLSGL